MGPPGRYGDVRLSLDNKTIAVDALVAQSQTRRVWTADVFTRRGSRRAWRKKVGFDPRGIRGCIKGCGIREDGAMVAA